MSESLSAEEIDHLLTAISAGDTEGENIKGIQDRKYLKTYDFKRPDLIDTKTFKKLSIMFKSFVARVLEVLAVEDNIKMYLASSDTLTHEECLLSSPTTTEWYISHTCIGNIIFEVGHLEVQNILPVLKDKLADTLGIEIPEMVEDSISFNHLSDKSETYYILAIEYAIEGKEIVFTIAFSAKALMKMYGGKMSDKNIKFDKSMITTKINASLGEATICIEDIDALGEGSIITLDREVGDLVPVYIDGKLFGKGEVVLLDDSFGIRLIEAFN
jgi:flagellar motor switch protein FliN